jgi:hypothetical protein
LANIFGRLDLVSLIAVSAVAQSWNNASRVVWTKSVLSFRHWRLQWHWLSTPYELDISLPKFALFTKREEPNLINLLEMRWTARNSDASFVCETLYKSNRKRTYKTREGDRNRPDLKMHCQTKKALKLHVDFTFEFTHSRKMTYSNFDEWGCRVSAPYGDDEEYRTHDEWTKYALTGQWAFVYPRKLPTYCWGKSK